MGVPPAAGTLIGRDAGLAAPDVLCAQTADGAGGVVMLAGEPGVGKTRLAREAAGRAAGQATSPPGTTCTGARRRCRTTSRHWPTRSRSPSSRRWHSRRTRPTQWWQLGAVSNAPQAAVNNGVIVSLAGHSTWAVTGPSYLTALSLDATSAVTGPRGGKVTMTVNGTPTTITPGASYTGAIVVTPA